MRSVKKSATSLMFCALIIGFGVISNACTGQSPLGISLEDGESNAAQEQPILPSDPYPDPPPPPADGDE